MVHIQTLVDAVVEGWHAARKVALGAVDAAHGIDGLLNLAAILAVDLHIQVADPLRHGRVQESNDII